MDRNEYKERLDEIEALIAAGDKDGALDILDGINWRKVHNVNLLLKAGEFYEMLECSENALDLLEAAHERSPIGRMIIYRLALVSINLGQFDRAKDYYDEFVEIAPHDSLKYVIKYRLNEARGADDTTLIAILEELRSHDLIEEWLFELACLYRKTAQVDRCIEICDEIVLWFGDGPYVEKALEMKLLYQPLDKQQEDKYRHFQQRRDGVTEITPEENYGGSEIINRPITIPQIDAEPEQFDTVNLQAAIRRNIEEIMQATEAGEISENMEAIKDLVEEIPYLKVQDEKEDLEEVRKQKRQEDREIGESLRSHFSEYLAEEYDGQLSLMVPPDGATDRMPIAGQLTIEEVIDRWERTKRAAEAALQDAEAKKLEQAKAKALAEANQIMDRLNEAIPKLDAGATPSDLMRDEILSRSADEENAKPSKKKSDEETAKSDDSKKTFSIPKVAAEGKELGVGLEIPVIDATKTTAEAAAEALISTALKEAKADEPELLTEKEVAERTSDWKPEAFSESEEKTVAPAEETKPEAEAEPKAEIKPEAKAKPEVKAEPKPEAKERPKAEPKPEVKAEPKPEVKAESKAEPKAEPKAQPKAVAPAAEPEAAKEVELPKTLSEEEKDIFSYFTPIKGMEKKLVNALNTERSAYSNETVSQARHLIIQGGKGSGKTTLATSIVKVLQNEGMLGSRALGKIDGYKLNEKNIRELFDKIKSGALIVENAGNITRDTAVTLSLLLDSDTSGILLVLEDSRLGVDKVLSLNANFSAKFTDRIEIPPLSIDELVSFGKSYASDLGYTIDETAVLALYDRINLISGVGHPTYLTGVKEIVDSAIDKAERRKGFLGIGGKKYDEEGKLILKEKDFDE